MFLGTDVQIDFPKKNLPKWSPEQGHEQNKVQVAPVVCGVFLKTES